jgi:transcriptional regulator with XRE-family HTH domain
VEPAGDTAALARRLRALREENWPHGRLTQARLARVFGVTDGLISSWESPSNAKVPPVERLNEYALYFAAERPPDKAIRPDALDAFSVEERRRYEHLHAELVGLRSTAVGDTPPETEATPAQTAGVLWFPPNENITIISSQLPEHLRPDQPYTKPDDPDYDKLTACADPTALVELNGYLRAVNPTNLVTYKIAGVTPLNTDDYNTHLVLVGGVDWNEVTRDVMALAKIPIRQVARPTSADTGGFVVEEGPDSEKTFKPVLTTGGDHPILREDVGQLYRGPSPYRAKRTVTYFNGSYARGTLGVVRALIDPLLRDTNDEYLRKRFADSDEYSMLMTVRIRSNEVVTPDWSVPRTRLYEWSRTDGVDE